MTRRTRTTRDAENRLAALENDAREEYELGWSDLMDYSIECAETENPPSLDEYFGEGWVMPDWVDDLAAAQERNREGCEPYPADEDPPRFE
jgi:hypothetical protein